VRPLLGQVVDFIRRVIQCSKFVSLFLAAYFIMLLNFGQLGPANPTAEFWSEKNYSTFSLRVIFVSFFTNPVPECMRKGGFGVGDLRFVLRVVCVLPV